MTNENPRRGGNTAGAEVADQFQQHQHTIPLTPIQSYGSLLDWALRCASRGLRGVLIRQMAPGLRIRLIEPECFVVVREQQP
jgi:hypothetical protein